MTEDMRHNPEGDNHPTVLAAKAERVTEALKLAQQGKTYRQIAATLDVAVSTAHGYVKEALAAITKPAAEEMRAVEDMRLEMLWENLIEQLQPRVVEAFDEEGTPVSIEVYDEAPKVIETARKLSESRRKLWGLDAPQAVEGQLNVAYHLNGVNPQDLT
jgi:hypothetical protein